MTTAAEPMAVDRADVRTIVGGGVKLGILTAVGVVAFALLARAMSGNTETLVLSLLVLAGGVVFGYLPALWTRPRSADGIAWCTLLGLLGAVAFTVLDVVLLRPLSVYHWTWDAIGGGSGFWYIPVWWMGSAFLAWLGGMVVAYAAQGGRRAGPALRQLGLRTKGVDAQAKEGCRPALLLQRGVDDQMGPAVRFGPRDLRLRGLPVHWLDQLPHCIR